MRAGGFDRGADLGLFVDDQIVEHDDVPGPQRWDEHLLDVGQKADVVDRAVEDSGRAVTRSTRNAAITVWVCQ